MFLPGRVVPMGTNEGGGTPLTEVEREALFAALDCGYFDDRTRPPTAAVAERLEVSEREARDRLCRGLAKLYRARREMLDELLVESR
jgi:predicted DNA binding protein